MLISKLITPLAQTTKEAVNFEKILFSLESLTHSNKEV